MPRFVLFLLCLAGGLLAIGWALLAPVHFRSVDERVLERVNQGSEGLVRTGLTLTNKAVAALFSQAAGQLQLEQREVLEQHVARLPLPQHQVWQIPIDPVEPVVASFIVNPNEKLRAVRESNDSFEASVVLRTAGMTNLTIFAPSGTAAGQPFEASILISAGVLKNGMVGREFQSSILQLMGRGDAGEIESFYLDMLALARRLNWDQMGVLLQQFESVPELGAFAEALRHFESDLAVLFSTAVLAEDAGAVGRYVLQYGAEGLQDLMLAVRHGKGALDRLIAEQAPIWHSSFRDKLLEYEPFYTMHRAFLYLATRWPGVTLFLKYELVFVGGFLLTLALRFTREKAGTELGYTWFPQLRLVRQVLAGALMVMLVMALGEPYLAQGDQSIEPAAKINLSLVLGALAPAAQTQTPETGNNMLDQYSILAVFMFMILQAILYVMCLLKLGEIRRQPLTSELKLRLLDNEEYLFDSGLYLGLLGTVTSLVLLALGILKPSLVTAYSSTLFGILFVSILKIGHIRPYRRRLLLETDSHRA